MSLCEILTMAFINPKKSIIRETNLSPFHKVELIRMFSEKSYAHPGNLSSCHETGNIVDFPTNRRIPEKTCPLSLILQGGIAFFAVFSSGFRFSSIIARNEKESVALSDVKWDSGFPQKSLILRNNLLPFYGMARDRMFSEKSHDSSFELISSRCVRFNCYIFK